MRSPVDSVLKEILVVEWSLHVPTLAHNHPLSQPYSDPLIATLLLPLNDPASPKSILTFVTLESLAIDHKRAGGQARDHWRWCVCVCGGGSGEVLWSY